MTSAEDRQAVDYNPASSAVKQDPEAWFSALRETCPVHHFEVPKEELAEAVANPFAGEPVDEYWSVLRHRDVTHMAQNPQIYSSAQGPAPQRMNAFVEGGVLIIADEPAHKRQRRLVAKAFTPRSVDLLAPRVQEVVDELLDEHADRGSMEFLSALGIPVAIRTMSGIFGLPDERTEDFKRWGKAVIESLTGDAESVAVGAQEIPALFGYVQSVIGAVRAGDLDSVGISPDGVLASLVLAEDDGNKLTDEEIHWICLQLITAGYETTSTAAANGVYLLCSHPEQRKLFEHADEAGVKVAVEEILRYMAPLEGSFRTANHGVEISGCPIPENAKIRAVWASANHDSEVFSNPSEFRIDRDPTELRSHLAFGIGPHMCMGNSLARTELRAVLETLFRRFPGLELDPDRPAVRNDALLINGFSEVHLRWDPSRVLSA